MRILLIKETMNSEQISLSLEKIKPLLIGEDLKETMKPVFPFITQNSEIKPTEVQGLLVHLL